MIDIKRFFIATIILTVCCTTVDSMKIEWGRMTGRWPCEASPILVDLNGDGSQAILAVNRDGQVMLWSLDGNAIGEGQDGCALKLPEDTWTSSPVVVESPGGKEIVICSLKGLVLALSPQLEILWEYALGAETTWGRAIPAVIRTEKSTMICLGDNSGTVTCLDIHGKMVWKKDYGNSKCTAPVQSISVKDGDMRILVSMGSVLYCLDTEGNAFWNRDLRGNILSRAEMISWENGQLIICGAGSGSLYGISLNGDVRWEVPVGDEIDTSIVFYPRNNSSPLILCTGLWGNVHAIDMNGNRVWTHYYRAKGRGVPLVADLNGDKTPEIAVTTYGSNVLVFNGNGEKVDERPLIYLINSSPVPIPNENSEATDILVTTGGMMAFRLSGTVPSPLYGKPGEPWGVTALFPDENSVYENPAIILNNPNGALIRTNVTVTGEDRWKRIRGNVSARSAFEIPLDLPDSGKVSVRVSVADYTGNILVDRQCERDVKSLQTPGATSEGVLGAWSTAAYGSFDETRLFPVSGEYAEGERDAVRIKNLYRNEADQGAFIIASTLDRPVRARVMCGVPMRDDKKICGGTIVLREAVPVGTVNGDRVADALPELMNGGIVTIPSYRSVKIWVSVDARNTESGQYQGKIFVLPLEKDVPSLEMYLTIDVLDLELPKEFPLTFCTWDYTPNGTLPDHVGEVVADMARHGVNVFPRPDGMPRAEVDPQGKLILDWSKVDGMLNRLKGKGIILFHSGHPPIQSAKKLSQEEKRKMELEYLRLFRDGLRERGWNYENYGFYPVDEPGLEYGKRVPVLLDAAKLLREAEPRFRIYTDPVRTLCWEDLEQIEPYIDIWCPNMRLASGLLIGDPRMERIRKSKATLWSYECISQVKSLSPLGYNRSNAWRAETLGLDGIGHWNHSSSPKDLWLPGESINDEYALVYPGEVLVPSARWEADRDGLEDIAAIRLLRGEIERNLNRGTKGEMVARAERMLGIAQTDIMEFSNTVFMESRDFLKQGDRRLWHTWTDLEMFRDHRAAIAKMTLELQK